MKKMFLVLSMFVFIGFFCIGCKKTPDEVPQDTETEYDQPAEDTSSVENETSSEPTITAPKKETSEQPISPLMDEFLRKSAGSTVKVTAGTQISAHFELWEAILQHKSMDIHFEVEAEDKVQKDHVWKNKNYRTVLDEFCLDNNLVWKITGSNTIRIENNVM